MRDAQKKKTQRLNGGALAKGGCMRKMSCLFIVAAVLSFLPGIAQAQDQPAAPPEGAAGVGQKPVVTKDGTASQPETAKAPQEKEASMVSAPASESAAGTAAPSTAPFIGNKGSKKVHRADCNWGMKTSPGKRVYFNAYDEAEKAGYAPCKTCKPQLAAVGIGAAKSSAPASAGEGFRASAKGKSFHRAGCEWAKKISAANLATYKTREEAIVAGKKPCSTCNP